MNIQTHSTLSNYQELKKIYLHFINKQNSLLDTFNLISSQFQK